MKFQKILAILMACAMFFFPKINYSQTPNLGAAANFVFFTTNGAITGNDAVSHVYGGDIGTNSGAITGLAGTITTGRIHNNDPLTSQASKDLLTAYWQMKNTTATMGPHAPAFGGGETLLPGVYGMAGAVSIAGTLTLDAQNNANATFIFKTSAGAFTTGSAAKIILINGASACNVAWVIEGAVSFGASANLQGTFISYDGALSLASGSTLNGRAYTTNGAISFTNVNVSIPTECADFIATKWLGGAGSNWNTPANWNNGIIPTSSSKITIPAGTLPYPIVSSGLDSVQSIIIENGAMLTVIGATLKIGGDILNSGTFDASSGTIELNGISAQTIAANTFLNNTVKNLIVSNNLSFSGPQNITSTLSFGSSNKTLTTNDNLTLKSTEFGTSRVADITNGGTLSGNAITGLITIERYIPAKRAWRLLSVPVSSTGAPTINTAWQEGAGGNSNTNPNPGFGVQITGGASTNGFDQGVNSNPSIKIYNTLTNKLEGIPASQGTNIPITSYPAYFLFVRGDRSTNLLQGTSAALTPTTLRMKGQILSGDVTVNVNAANNTFIGNPYTSAIDFSTLTKTNVNNMFYVWNPQLNSVGGYVTVSFNSSTGNYDVTPSPSTVSQYIQSGEGFIVQTTDGSTSGSLTFKESDKNNGGSNFTFKNLTEAKKLKVNLITLTTAGVSTLLDGVLTTYTDESSNAVDKNDAKKLYNIGENICIGRESKNLAIERRQTIEGNDTTFLNMYNLKKRQYSLQLVTEGMDSIGLHAIIKDNYVGSSKDTALNMGGITNINFTVNADSASYAANRFSIVFKQDLRLLPVVFSSVKAQQNFKNIAVEWTIEKEFKITKYTVEISTDNFSFKKADTLIANANNNTKQSYTWVDKYVVGGMHYYRISATDILGKTTYSPVVNVSVKGINEKNIIVCGSILKNSQFALRLNNIDQGRYNLKLFSMDGRIINEFLVEHPGGNAINNFTIDKNVLPGKYEIILSGKNVKYQTSFIKE